MASSNSKVAQIALKVFTVLACMGFVVHFSLTLAYSFRDQLPTKGQQLADRYCVPMFHQNWKLFAPDLSRYNTELEYRTAHNGAWTNWEDASASFGFGTHSRIETIEQGFNTALGWQVTDNFYAKQGRAQFDRIVQSSAYGSALFFVLKMHELQHDEIEPDSVQLRLQFRFTPPPDQAYTFQMSSLEFPVYQMPKIER